MTTQEALDIFGTDNTKVEDNFDFIRISIASPEHIHAWSFGEIKKPETINYRTFKPERDGLFCARIFGPTKDYECLCGKYKRMKYKGVICEKCGVEVTLSKVRRERMGHVDLAAPVAHIWFMKSLPSRIANMLDMTLKSLERVLYFDSFIVIEPGVTELAAGQLLTEDEHREACETYGEDEFTAEIGAEAVRTLLEAIDLEKLRDQLRVDLHEATTEAKTRKIAKRLKLVEAFIGSGNRPEWMILTVLPVLPPELRPLVPLEGSRFATSDLNDLYRRVINRNNRLRRLMELRSPDIIIRNEKRMLQESVDALFDNGRRGRAITGSNKRPLKSLSDMLKGKQGRFRQNLLGKRVDYSGRSVIVVGPELKLHQCGLPKHMALELFKPFIYSGLARKGLSATLKQSKKMIEAERPEVWDILDQVIREHPVLLNRAPTLHRLGIQAFEPVLIEGKAIQLHPLVCTAFNADFDGDQMAVHVPLSLEAQLEARVLMMSTNNILHPADGSPIIVPSQDIVLGLYYISRAVDNEPGEGMAFTSLAEIRLALDAKIVTLHSKIKARRETFSEKGKSRLELVDTTPGRMMLGELLPYHPNLPFDVVNRLLTSKEISSVIDRVYRRCGQKATVIFCDQIMALGFREACKAGISLGKDDMLIPPEKSGMIDKTKELVNEYERQYAEGLITQGEKYNKVIDAWSDCTDRVAEEMTEKISAVHIEEKTKRAKPINSLYMMAHSGARGSPAQMKQLAGMRGLMARPSGEIIETPIISNFKEGLTMLEYFNSTHGARKGLADTALKTANSGYLTRRLVDVAQDCIVSEFDCGSKAGILLKPVEEAGNLILPLAKRISGRTPVNEIIAPSKGSSKGSGKGSGKKGKKEVLAKANDIISEEQALAIESAGIREVEVRTPLTCTTRDGICALCYGRDLARGTDVNIGEAVGIVAAQSIGEPGTQLTMRTFHVGGAAQIVSESFLEAVDDGKLQIQSPYLVTNSSGEVIVMGRGRRNILTLTDKNNVERMNQKLQLGMKLLVKNNASVQKGQRIAEWDPYTKPIITEVNGEVGFEDMIDGVSMKEVMDETTGITQRVVIDWSTQPSAADLAPSIVIKDKKGEVMKVGDKEARYALSVDAVLSADQGQSVKAGDILARIPTDSAKTRDITGGLPRVAELFEARPPRDHAILAKCSGRIEFTRGYKTRRLIRIHPEDETEEIAEYKIGKDRHLQVRDGDEIEKGETLVDGHPDPHDILDIFGVSALARYLIDSVQEIYRLQGVYINDKHIEIIIRQMLQKVEITDAGDSLFIAGEQTGRIAFEDANDALKAEDRTPAQARPILLGITKSSLQTSSFISAASFQETTRVLTEAAVAGRVDDLHGLKENVIVGRLIPVGTGRIMQELRHEAHRRSEALAATQSSENPDDKNDAENSSDAPDQSDKDEKAAKALPLKDSPETSSEKLPAE